MPFSTPDLVALIWFVAAWTGYAILLEYIPHSRPGLNARMNGFREVWMRRMLDREMRMVDMQIMASLQNGTAFFASTSLLAVGGALTLLRSTPEVLSLVGDLPLGPVYFQQRQHDAGSAPLATAARGQRSSDQLLQRPKTARKPLIYRKNHVDYAVQLNSQSG